MRADTEMGPTCCASHPMWLITRPVEICDMILLASNKPTQCILFTTFIVIELNHALALTRSGHFKKQELCPSGACISIVHKSLSIIDKF